MLRWLVLIVFALGCGGSAQIRPRSPEYLAKIRLEGNQAIASGDLIPRLALERTRRGGRALDPYQLGLDTQRLRAAYLRLGFFEVKVTSRIEGTRGPQTAVFVIVEGPRAKARVEIRGLPPDIPEAHARELIGIAEGSPFDYATYDAAKQPLLALVEAAGYAYAQLDAAVVADQAAGIAVARYVFQPGPRCTFGAVTISGVDGDLAEAIRGRLAFAAGETYSPAALAETQRALYDLGRFSTVRIDFDRSGAAVLPITVAVAAGTRREVKLGGGVGFEPQNYELRARGGASYILEDHPLWTLAADARLAALFDYDDPDDPAPKVRVLGTAQRLDVLRPRLTGEIGVGFDFLAVEAYTSTGPLVRLSLSSPLGTSRLQLRAGWSLSYLAFTEVSPAVDAAARDAYGLDRAQRLGSFQQTLIADLRDNPLNARRGAYLALRVAEGTGLAGGAFDYVQLTPDVRVYVPLGPMVLALRARAGTILGEVPVTERFFSGGQNHRGFTDRKLAPSASAVVDGTTVSEVIGGTTLFELGGELRIPIGGTLGATMFVDAGDVTEDRDALDLGNLHWAAGLGVTLDLGGIKLRGEAAYRLNRNGPTEPEPDGMIENTALHFGVGDTF